MPVALAVSIFYTFPLILILMAPFTGSGHVTPPRVAAFVVAFAGILICVGPSLSGLDWRGVALALAASVACAALFEVTSRVKQDQVRMMFWVMVYAQAFVIPAALVSGAPPPGALAAAAAPILVSALGFYIGFAGQIVAGRLLAPATVGLLFLLEPVVAVLAAGVLLSETVTAAQAAGIGLVIAGLALDVWTQSRQASTSGR
jgi:drug/metabolite transporter (DMT)-like permease